MQRKIMLIALAGACLIAGTAGAAAQGYDRPYYGRQSYDRYGNAYAWGPQVVPGYAAVPPGRGYYYRPSGWGALNGANHPTPSSTQGDVGPEGNNNGTLTGVYRAW